MDFILKATPEYEYVCIAGCVTSVFDGNNNSRLSVCECVCGRVLARANQLPDHRSIRMSFQNKKSGARSTVGPPRADPGPDGITRITGPVRQDAAAPPINHRAVRPRPMRAQEV